MSSGRMELTTKFDDQNGGGVFAEDRQNTRQQEQDEQDFLHFFACDYRTANL